MRKTTFQRLLMTSAVGVPAVLCNHAQAASASDGDASGLEEVVVTAQRRAERAQDVPISITSADSELLEKLGVRNTADLARVTPGLQFTQSGAFAQVSLRGVAARTTNAGDSGPVAIYVDGVYLPALTSGHFGLPDVERIEVLKGPQGTLYGRNATAGVINIVTKGPGRVPEAETNLSYASFGKSAGDVFMATPLGSKFSASVALSYDKDEGYTRDVVTDEHLRSVDSRGGRVKLKFTPTDNASFTLAYDNLKQYANQPLAYNSVDGKVSVLRTNPTATVVTTRGEVALSVLPSTETNADGGSLTADLDFAAASIKSISAYRTSVTHNKTDADFTPVNSVGGLNMVDQPSNTFTQDVIVSSNGDGPLKWTVGGFYMHDLAKRMPTPTTTTLAIVTTDAIAGFGDLTYELNDHWSATGGIRYSRDRKDLENFSNGVPRVDTSDNWDNVTYRAILQYTVDSHLNFYVNRSTGFKAGAYNPISFTNPPVLPETLGAWSAGFKYSNNGLVLDGDVFHYDYENMQVQSCCNLDRVGVLQNAAASRIYGGELSGAMTFGEHLEGNFGIAYTHGRYTSFPGAQAFAPRADGFGNMQVTVDATGNPTQRTPPVTFNAGLTYRRDMLGGHASLSGSVFHTGAFNGDPANRVITDSYELVRAEAAWSTPNDRYTVTGWVDNLTDTSYYVIKSSLVQGDYGVYGRPRQFGINLSVKF